MDGRYVYLFISILVVTFFSVSNEGKELYIKDSIMIKIKPFDDRLDTKKLNTLVVDALTSQYKNRKMLDVSKTRYKFHTVWRGVRRFFWENILKVFCPSINRELKTAKLLKGMLYNDKNVKEKLGIVLPSGKSKKLAKEEDEEEEENSDEESDEDVKHHKNNSKKSKKSKSSEEESTEEDDDDDEEEDKKKKKSGKKNLDDLFK